MRSLLTWMFTVVLVCAPGFSYGADTPESDQELNLRNVELTPGGSLEGQLLSTDGKPIADAEVVARSQSDLKKVGQKVLTDADGRFLVTRLQGGTCIVETGLETYAVRVWKKGTAPPGALRNVALVQAGDETVRGNWRDSRLVNWVEGLSTRQKATLALLMAAAIAVPLALDDGS